LGKLTVNWAIHACMRRGFSDIQKVFSFRITNKPFYGDVIFVWVFIVFHEDQASLLSLCWQRLWLIKVFFRNASLIFVDDFCKLEVSVALEFLTYQQNLFLCLIVIVIVIYLRSINPSQDTVLKPSINKKTGVHGTNISYIHSNVLVTHLWNPRGESGTSVSFLQDMYEFLDFLVLII
jgi:hypothetical protein